MAGMWITRLGIKGHERKGDPTPPSQVLMKRDIWKALPEDVFERVVARLPLQSVIRMQTVCKKWKIKVRSPTFIRLCEVDSEAPRTEWFLTFAQQKAGTVCFAYDVQVSKWLSIPLGFLPFDLNNRSPLAAADGLICLGAGWNANSRGAMPTKLVICNPVSRFWRDVPLPPQLDPALSILSVAGLAVDRLSGAYKLIVVGEVRREAENADSREVKFLVAYIFDSVSQVWSSYEVELDPLDSFTSFLANHFRTLVGHSIRAVLCSVVCEEVLYCLTARPYQLHAFNVENEGWNRLKISLPAEISGPSLVARPGRLFLVGAYRHNQHDKGNNIGIWELDQETQRWNVVDILLEAMRSSHGRKSPPKSPPGAIKEDGDDDDVILFVKWATRFLAYNVSKKSWLWLPACVPSAQGNQPYHNGYLFTPSLLLP